MSGIEWIEVNREALLHRLRVALPIAEKLVYESTQAARKKYAAWLREQLKRTRSLTWRPEEIQEASDKLTIHCLVGMDKSIRRVILYLETMVGEVVRIPMNIYGLAYNVLSHPEIIDHLPQDVQDAANLAAFELEHGLVGGGVTPTADETHDETHDETREEIIEEFEEDSENDSENDSDDDITGGFVEH